MALFRIACTISAAHRLSVPGPRNRMVKPAGGSKGDGLMFYAIKRERQGDA